MTLNGNDHVLSCSDGYHMFVYDVKNEPHSTHCFCLAVFFWVIAFVYFVSFGSKECLDFSFVCTNSFDISFERNESFGYCFGWKESFEYSFGFGESFKFSFKSKEYPKDSLKSKDLLCD